MIKFNSWLCYFLGIFTIALFVGCTDEVSDNQDEVIYQSLKENQSKFLLKLDGEYFYKTESIFDGNLQLYPTTFALTSFDQFDSNVMIHFNGKDIYKDRPMRIPMSIEKGNTSTLMFGRMKDKQNNLGEGYLMSEGFITFKAFSKEKIIMKIEGKAKKYPKTKDTDPSFEVSALFVCKKPEVGYIDIDEKKVFY